MIIRKFYIPHDVLLFDVVGVEEMVMAMSVEERLERIERILEELKSTLEELCSLMRERIERREELMVIRGGRADVESLLSLALKELKNIPEGVTARELAQRLQISRSHASGILNELFRMGKVTKKRIRREVRYFLKEEEGEEEETKL